MLILLTAGCFVYADAIWINGSGDRDWSAAINWVPGVPQSADTAIINSTFEGPIIHGGVKAADTVKLGDAGTGQAYLYLNAGSILNVGSTCSIGQESDGILHINGGFLDVVLGGGDTVGNVSVGGPDGGNGTVQMTGGTIQTWDMGVGLYSGNGTVTINDGVIEVLNPAGGLSMTARGLINIKGGSMLLEGDQTPVCKNYISAGWIIAYDGNGRVLIDYDNINPGMTTLWAVDSALAADFDNSNEVGLGDLSYLAISWLETDLEVRPVGDISGDSTVDGLDFSMFAGQWLSVKELGFSRFIGPEDCPGVSQFADPYVFKENDAFYLTSTYTVGTPMYMFSTTDFLGKERYTLNLDLNESYLRGYFSDPGLVAYHVWGFVPYKHTDN
ncbi:MAG: hypothetical protein ACYSPI_13385, partial [Planctomycetota bacterium]